VGQTVSTLDWVVIASYALGLAGIALYHYPKMKKQDDLFLAGRSMRRWPVAISMYMALFSTNSFVGGVGWVNRPKGTVWIALQNAGIMMAVPLVIWLYPSLFYRLRITTAYEYLERRFSYPVRAVASLLFMGARIMWMSTMLYAASLLLKTMLGWTPDRGVPHGEVLAPLLLAALGTLYACVGGMHAVIWTDVAQFGVLMSGVLTMVVIAVRQAGGFSSALSIAWQAGKLQPPPFFSLTADISIVSGLLLGFVAYLSNAGADQLILQTYLSGRSEKEIQDSLWRNGLFLKPLSVIYPMLGILVFVYYRSHPTVAQLMRIPDDALPVFVTNVLPAGVRGLMVAALSAALISGLEGGMAALSAALQVDFILRKRREPVSERNRVRLGRFLIVLWGVTIFLGSLAVSHLGSRNNIIEILNIVMYPFLGVLLGIFLLGLLTHRAQTAGTLIGACGGFLATISLRTTSPLLGLAASLGLPVSRALTAFGNSQHAVSTLFYGFMGASTTIILGYLASCLFSPPPDWKLNGLTRFRLPPSQAVESECATGARIRPESRDSLDS
jgi:SSS family transporter